MKNVMSLAVGKPKKGLFFLRLANCRRSVSRLRLGFALTSLGALLLALGCQPSSARTNAAGGIIPGSPNVTVGDNGNGIVTMANGIVDITINKSDYRVGSIHYAFTSGGTFHTVETDLYNAPGHENYYFGGIYLGSGAVTYSLATNPASNGGNYADVELITDTTGTNSEFEVHYSMLRGSPGFYTTAIQRHRSQDTAHPQPSDLTAFGITSRSPDSFDWLSEDPSKNFLVGAISSGGTGYHPLRTAYEMAIYAGGGLAGEYSDKFINGTDHGDLQVWGWSSVTPSSVNYSRWMMTWYVNRVGPTVIEIGVPDRKAGEFHHGEEYYFQVTAVNSGGYSTLATVTSAP